MRTHQHGSLRLRQPLVFRLVYGAALAIFGLLTLVTGALSVLTAAPPHIVATLFFLSLLLLALYLVPLLLSSYIAATSGIERHGLFGARQEIAWADVTRVSVYPILFFRGIVNIVGRHSERIAVPRVMPGFIDLIRMIELRAPHADVSPQVVEPVRASRLGVLLGIVLAVVAYVALKLMYRLSGYREARI